ncbi:acetylornithine aminotransferase [Penicillium pulvis]|uniref:acetylornithine aminotransferase n=1 Tax=Penicillium pulvis TaxID=1562058 RepID=UPI0025471B85|nr:acetylornithine aminotransferase [Penicillium pulvis]KAJ5805729.1 acetylornithine aminotransferase [Penicillium pulvis]
MSSESTPAKWDALLATHHQELTEDYISSNPHSQEAFDKARRILPGGNTRSVLYAVPFPLCTQSAHDAFITSIDGKEYVDFVSDFSACLFGHSHPTIARAIDGALKFGFSLGAITQKETDLAYKLQQRFNSIERVRYCNSGTEANIYAIAAAKAFTRKSKVLVFQNGYHGGVLSFGTTGNTTNIPHEFIIGKFNNIEATEPLISPDLAVILVEPMQSAGGMQLASKEFLAFLRSAADKTGAVLIFDEVVTSRLHYNGLQGHFGIKPDMTTLGKYLGGGLSFGAFGGRDAIMSLFDPAKPHNDSPLQHSGTFNNNIFTMSAALAAAEIVTPEEIQRINNLGDRLRQGEIRLSVKPDLAANW